MCCCTGRPDTITAQTGGVWGTQKSTWGGLGVLVSGWQAVLLSLSLTDIVICYSGGTPPLCLDTHKKKERKNSTYLGSKKQNACTLVLLCHWMLSILIPSRRPFIKTCSRSLHPTLFHAQGASFHRPPTPSTLLCVSHPGTSLGVICHLVRHLCSIRSAALYHPRHCPMMQSCTNQPFPSRLLCAPLSAHPRVTKNLRES